VETKWEKFAKAKGIGQNKDKRSSKVWDDTVGDWQYRHGYKKAGNDNKEWPIMEVKAGDDPMIDPWEKQRDAKRKRVDKNLEQNMRNEERSGNLSKGTSTRVLKSLSASRKAGREGGNVNVPVGVPVDLKSSGKKGNSDVVTSNTVQRLQRGKVSTNAALLATQVSTASLGKFDKMREGEPERSKAISKSVVKKRKFESATDKNVIATEAQRSMKVLKSLSSNGAAKEKDRVKGRLATGETAYDYDYDDGLGASTFRKKKGRAGAGKMKKMTKKRSK
jgi:regulator of ribosome biosynthesis